MRRIRAGLFVFLGVVALSTSTAHGHDLNGSASERKFGGEANLSFIISRICTGLQRTPHSGSAQNESGVALLRLVFGEWCDPSLDGIDPFPEDGEAFRGENLLEGKLSGVDFSGHVLVGDSSYGRDNDNHYRAVAREMTDIGVPAGNISGHRAVGVGATPGYESTYRHTYLFATINRDPSLPSLEDLRVVVLPIGRPFSQHGVADAIGRHNVVFVGSAGNTGTYGHDLYTADYPIWAEVDAQNGWPQGYSSFAETMNTLRTGKALLAVWAAIDEEGNIVPDPTSVDCGDAQEACIAAMLPWGPFRSISPGTSLAAPRVGAAAFYLFQMWDRAEDVVGVLKRCAIDIGEPGVDREFGVGALNVDCPIVANREVDTVRVSLRTELRSPLLDSANDAPGSFPLLGFDRDGSAVKLGSVTPKGFVSERYQGIGLSAPFAGGEVTGLVGAGVAPLGVSSPLASAEADAFFEVGMKRHLLDFGNHSLSLVGSYGESHDGMDSSAARLGLRHEWQRDRATFSLYAGALRAGGSIGIPGYTDVSRPRVSVREDSPEVRAQYTLRFF